MSRLGRFRRATERARAVLCPHDRLRITRCGGGLVNVRFTGWDPVWPNVICSASLSDIHALNVRKLNGEPISFDDPPGFVPPRITLRDRIAEWWARGRMDRAIWRHQHLPFTRLWTESVVEDELWPDREGWVLSLGWLGRRIDLAYRPARHDEVPF